MSITEPNKWYLIGSSPNETINQTVRRLSNGNFEAQKAFISIGNDKSNNIPEDISGNLNGTNNPILTNPSDSRIILESSNSDKLPWAVPTPNNSDSQDHPFNNDNWGEINLDMLLTPTETTNGPTQFNLSLGVWVLTTELLDSTWNLSSNFTPPVNDFSNSSLNYPEVIIPKFPPDSAQSTHSSYVGVSKTHISDDGLVMVTYDPYYKVYNDTFFGDNGTINDEWDPNIKKIPEFKNNDSSMFDAGNSGGPYEWMKQVNDHASMNLFIEEHQDPSSNYVGSTFHENALNPLTFDYSGSIKHINPNERCHKPAFFPGSQPILNKIDTNMNVHPVGTIIDENFSPHNFWNNSVQLTFNIYIYQRDSINDSFGEPNAIYRIDNTKWQIINSEGFTVKLSVSISQDSSAIAFGLPDACSRRGAVFVYKKQYENWENGTMKTYLNIKTRDIEVPHNVCTYSCPWRGAGAEQAIRYIPDDAKDQISPAPNILSDPGSQYTFKYTVDLGDTKTGFNSFGYSVKFDSTSETLIVGGIDTKMNTNPNLWPDAEAFTRTRQYLFGGTPLDISINKLEIAFDNIRRTLNTYSATFQVAQAANWVNTVREQHDAFSDLSLLKNEVTAPHVEFYIQTGTAPNYIDAVYYDAVDDIMPTFPASPVDPRYKMVNMSVKDRIEDLIAQMYNYIKNDDSYYNVQMFRLGWKSGLEFGNDLSNLGILAGGAGGLHTSIMEKHNQIVANILIAARGLLESAMPVLIYGIGLTLGQSVLPSAFVADLGLEPLNVPWGATDVQQAEDRMKDTVNDILAGGTAAGEAINTYVPGAFPADGPASVPTYASGEEPAGGASAGNPQNFIDKSLAGLSSSWWTNDVSSCLYYALENLTVALYRERSPINLINVLDESAFLGTIPNQSIISGWPAHAWVANFLNIGPIQWWTGGTTPYNFVSEPTWPTGNRPGSINDISWNKVVSLVTTSLDDKWSKLVGIHTEKTEYSTVRIGFHPRYFPWEQKNSGKGGFAIFDTNYFGDFSFNLVLSSNDLPSTDSLGFNKSELLTSDSNLGYCVNLTTPLSWSVKLDDNNNAIRHASVYVIGQGIETHSEGTNNGFIVITREPLNIDNNISNWNYIYYYTHNNSAYQYSTIFEFDRYNNLYTASRAMRSKSSGKIGFYQYLPSSLPNRIGTYDLSGSEVLLDSNYTSDLLQVAGFSDVSGVNSNIVGWETNNINFQYKISFSTQHLPASESLYEDWIINTSKLPIYDMVISKSTNSMILSFFESVRSYSISWHQQEGGLVNALLTTNNDANFDKRFNLPYLTDVTNNSIDPGLESNITPLTQQYTIGSSGGMLAQNWAYQNPYMTPSFAKSIASDSSFNVLVLSSIINSSLGYWNTWIDASGTIPSSVEIGGLYLPNVDWSLVPLSSSPPSTGWPESAQKSIFFEVSGNYPPQAVSPPWADTAIAGAGLEYSFPNSFITEITMNIQSIGFSETIVSTAGKDVNGIILASKTQGTNPNISDQFNINTHQPADNTLFGNISNDSS